MITSGWPLFVDTLADAEVNAEMDWVVRLISQVRAVRSEMNVPPKARIPLLMKDAGEAARVFMECEVALIMRLARRERRDHLDGEVPKGAVQDVIDEATIILPLADVIDVAEEKARLEKEISRLADDIEKIDIKLANRQFLDKAPTEVVEKQKERRADAEQARAKLDAAHARLGGA